MARPSIGDELVFPSPVQAKSPDHEKLVGTWALQGYGAQIFITPCGHAGERLCDQITGFWTDRAAAGVC
ncbi:MAG: hypothetical protein CMI60_11830 [Parvibaculum sp.]|mgnify:FL=1|nr:hypothetical protein [Parvibaculum sp.]